jgi:hypothetical protein
MNKTETSSYILAWNVFLTREVEHKASREEEIGRLYIIFIKITVSVKFVFTSVLTASEENHLFTRKGHVCRLYCNIFVFVLNKGEIKHK